MRADLRPYWVKKLLLDYRKWYTEHFLRPCFTALGDHHDFMGPRYTFVSGNVSLGKCATVMAEVETPVRIGVWGRGYGEGVITIGDYVMISPGTRISASDAIHIGDSCMFATGVYITDSDWHGIYDRINRDPEPRPITLGNNVWVGDHATILKGVTIGDNSIVGAGAVVTKPVPANVVVAGNPAKIVKTLDPAIGFHTRAEYFADPLAHAAEMDRLNKFVLGNNSTWRWLLSLVWPGVHQQQDQQEK